MRKTKAELQAEVKNLQINWIAPEVFASLAADRDNLREQLATVKAARDHLQQEVTLLRQRLDQTELHYDQQHDVVSQLELMLEELIPEEFLGEEWDDLTEPTRQYVEELQRQSTTKTSPASLKIHIEKISIEIDRD